MSILVAGVGIIVYAATAPAGTQYTVTFDAGTGGFSFTNKDGSAVATISDGTTTYPNLFQIEGAMPGDSYVWTITVAVKNAGTNTVKMYATVGDHNADYTKLLSTASAIHPTLTAAFDLDTTPPNTLNSLINKLNLSGKTTSADRKSVFSSNCDTWGTYLGAYTGASSSKDITMTFTIPTGAGNEFADLDAQVHWVFTAEVIPPDGGGGGGGGTGGGGGGVTPPGKDDKDDGPVTIPNIVDEVEKDGSVTIGDLVITPEMLRTPWAFETREHFAYIIGYPESDIQPTGTITRAEIVTIMFRCMREELRDYWWATFNRYPDVPSTSWYNNAISTLTNAGVIVGYEDGLFRPDAPMTRAEFCTVIGRYFALMEGRGIDYADIHAHWAEEIIRSVTVYGFVEGYEDGTFRPDSYLQRAETATIMNRILGRKPQLGHLSPDMIRWPDNMDTSKWYYLDMQEATNSHDYSKGGAYESWTKWVEPPDWKSLETQWADKNTNQSVRIHRSTDEEAGI